jgi:hypothetical protein
MEQQQLCTSVRVCVFKSVCNCCQGSTTQGSVLCAPVSLSLCVLEQQLCAVAQLRLCVVCLSLEQQLLCVLSGLDYCCPATAV